MTNSSEFRLSLRALIESIARYQDQCADCCQLTFAQCETLDSLARLGPCSLTDLARDLELDVSTVSRGVDAMVQRGLAERTPDRADRRRVVLSLTVEGAALAQSVSASGSALAGAVLSGLATDRQAAVVAAMHELSGAIDRALSHNRKSRIEDLVRHHYARAAVGVGSTCCGTKLAARGCCEPAGDGALCCGDGFPDDYFGVANYSLSQAQGLPHEIASTSLGCGNPHAIAAIGLGETVVDLGSGAGLDALLAAERVGATGMVHGIDMTAEMVKAARTNALRAGFGNVQFHLASIDALPLADATADVVLSNCVINLVVDKDGVFAEAFRVLRPGGRLAVSDMVFLSPPPAAVREDAALWAACVGGALTVAEYEERLAAAGFVEISITPGALLDLPYAPSAVVAKADISATRPHH